MKKTGVKMCRKINYPAPENYAARLNTESEVAKLAINSNIENLLRTLDTNGYDVSAALIELVAMKNYIRQKLKSDAKIRTHFEYIIKELNK